MMVEGKGRVAPKSIVITLDRCELNQLRIAAAARDKFRGYANRSDKWGRGSISNPTFIGMCGEAAVCRYVNRIHGCNARIDLRLLEAGDDGSDLCVLGLRIQVKTSAKNRDECLLRRVDSRGRIMKMNFDVVVQAATDGLGRVELQGWTWHSAAKREAFAKSPHGDWLNLKIPAESFNPMCRLLDALRAAKEAA